MVSVRFLPPSGLNSIFAVPFASAVTRPSPSTDASFGFFDVNTPVSPAFTAICSDSSTSIAAEAFEPVSVTLGAPADSRYSDAGTAYSISSVSAASATYCSISAGASARPAMDSSMAMMSVTDMIRMCFT